MNRSDAEFIQYRCPVGAGPSSNTCPRCESALAERTSVRLINKCRSSFVRTLAGTRGFVKLGHPVPDSNLSSELKSGSPETTSTYMPASWLSQYSLRNGGSVPSCCVTLYCSGVSRSLSSVSFGFVYVDIQRRKRQHVRLSTSAAMVDYKSNRTKQASRVPPGVLATMADPLKGGDAKLWRLRRSCGRYASPAAERIARLRECQCSSA